MGYGGYDSGSRAARSCSLGYDRVTTDSVAYNNTFKQQSLRTINEGLNPKNVNVRESRDSETNPLTVPIELYLDGTGSMGSIPKMMIATGLPKLISTLIENRVTSPALMFGVIGDHKCDQFPLQVAQFESGDAELDDWLTKSYIEGNGGGNGGESYLLAWYFSAFHTSIDSWEKRNKKGYVFTIGDEPTHRDIPQSFLRDLMGNTVHPTEKSNYSDVELLDLAKQKKHVYHVHINHGGYDDVTPRWKELLGSNLLVVNDHNEIPNLMAQTH